MNILNPRYKLLESLQSEFLVGFPFPYLIFKDFLDDEFFSQLNNLDKDVEKERRGKDFDSNYEKNKWISLNSDLPKALQQIIKKLNSNEWLKNLEKLTSLSNIHSTQNDNKNIANYHEMRPGGQLLSHVDHSFEKGSGFPHVLNIIIYLSEDWSEKYGGSTLFFDHSGKKIIKRIPYEPNTAIIFLHTPYSFHGVEKIDDSCPHKRKTLYIDYYSNQRDPFVNLNLPFPNHFFHHGTTFSPGPIKKVNLTDSKYLKSYLKYKVNRFLVPINISIGTNR